MQLELQKIVFNYFENTDDKTISEIISGFMYDKKNISHKASKLFEKFLDDNELSDTYADYIYDLTSTAYFRRSNSSGIQMIEQIKISFLNLCYNRFRDILDNQKPEIKLKEANKIKFRFEDEEEPEVHILSNLNPEYTICGILTEGDHIHDIKHNVSQKTNCLHCISVIKKHKKTKL